MKGSVEPFVCVCRGGRGREGGKVAKLSYCIGLANVRTPIAGENCFLAANPYSLGFRINAPPLIACASASEFVRRAIKPHEESDISQFCPIFETIELYPASGDIAISGLSFNTEAWAVYMWIRLKCKRNYLVLSVKPRFNRTCPELTEQLQYYTIVDRSLAEFLEFLHRSYDAIVGTRR